MTVRRRMHVRQQGARLSWLDSMFELVEAVPLPLYETIPVPDEVVEVDMPAFIAAQRELEQREASQARPA